MKTYTLFKYWGSRNYFGVDEVSVEDWDSPEQLIESLKEEHDIEEDDYIFNVTRDVSGKMFDIVLDEESGVLVVEGSEAKDLKDNEVERLILEINGCLLKK